MLVGGGAVPSALCFPSGACSLTLAPQRWSPLGEGAALRFHGVSVRVRCPFSLSSIPGFVSPALCGGDYISALPCLWCLTLDRSVVGGWEGSRAFLPLPPAIPKGSLSTSLRGHGPAGVVLALTSGCLGSDHTPLLCPPSPRVGPPAVGCRVASPTVWLLSSHHLCS